MGDFGIGAGLGEFVLALCRAAGLPLQVAAPSSELSPDDLRHVEAAHGFLGLGLYDEAWEELEEVQPTARAAADVLALRVEILLAKDQADYARAIAAGAVRMHPEVGGCHYALALVEARASNFPAVKESLAAAFRVAPELRTLALDDERLAAFWTTLGQ